MNELQDFFSLVNSFFDHVYVITLRRAKDRHERLQEELNGLNYELFFGKDKQEFSIDELKRSGVYNESIARLNHRYNKGMAGGQIGCAWSHAEVYKDCIEKGYNRILILEDDVVIDADAANLFTDILQAFPTDWELIYFGFAEREKLPVTAPLKKAFYHLLRSFGFLKFSHTAINHYYPTRVSKYIFKAGNHDCTHAYAITNSGAKKLLHLQQPISFIADNLLAYAVTNEIVKGYIILPKIINQQYQVGIDSVSYLNQ